MTTNCHTVIFYKGSTSELYCSPPVIAKTDASGRTLHNSSARTAKDDVSEATNSS